MGVSFTKTLLDELREIYLTYALVPSDQSVGMAKIGMGAQGKQLTNSAPLMQSILQASLDFPAFLSLMAELVAKDFGNLAKIAKDRLAKEEEERTRHEKLLRAVQEEKEKKLLKKTTKGTRNPMPPSTEGEQENAGTKGTANPLLPITNAAAASVPS